jgi:putative membrane protein
MNINTESKHAVKQDHAQFPKFTTSSATRLGMTLMALGFLLAVSCAKAQTFITMTDTNFILAAAQGGMTEVKLGELAAQKGLRGDVKDFGQMMVKDHTDINADLKTLAAQKGVTLPQSLDAEHQDKVDKMAALTGSGFDDAYINGMIQAHQMDAKAFRAESAATQDAGIKYFVNTSIPVVESHLKQATVLKK